MSDQDRLRTRRLFAYVAFWVSALYGIMGITSLFSDDIMRRLVQGWGPNATIFMGFMGYVGWYNKLGSDETKHAMEIEASKS